MKRRWLSLVCLVMLLASLCSTEQAEVWCRVAVGAAVDTDDDDGSYFTYRDTNTVRYSPPGLSRSRQSAGRLLLAGQNSVSAPNHDTPIADSPTSIFVQTDVALVSLWAPTVTLPVGTITFHPVVRRSPVRSACFIRPPPRAPPMV